MNILIAISVLKPLSTISNNLPHGLKPYDAIEFKSVDIK